MWLYFDKNGALKEILEYGNVPNSGTTNFEIFAYFEGTNIVELYKEATIKLYKPDFYGTAYPSLLMTQKSFVFDSSISESAFFENGKSYLGYYFNFGDFKNDEEVEVLLDVPGIWRAIITLISTSNYNVVGEVLFTVQPGIETNEETNASFDAVLNQVYRALATKLGAYTTSVVVPETDLYVEGIGYKENTLYYVVGDNPDAPYKVVMWNGDSYAELGTVNLESFASKEEFVDFANNQETLRLDWEEQQASLRTAWETQQASLRTMWEAAQETRLASFGNEINSFENYVNEEIEEIRTIAASGGPKGVYETVSALRAANPNHDYFYYVKADGHIYYWNETTNDWADAGAYACPLYVGVDERAFILNDTSYASRNERKLFFADAEVDDEQKDRTITL